MSFWKELKRRNVYKVGIAYAIVAWLLIQAAAIVSPALQLPNWMLPVVIVLLCIGFPIAILLAWAYEVTPEGIKRTKEVPLSESITHLTGRKLNYILAGLLILAIAYILFNNYYLDRRAIETEVTPTVAEEVSTVVEVKEAPKTIAVLPFDDLSPEKDQEYFVIGLSEEILNSLAQIADLTVIAKTSSFSFKGMNKTIQEIVSILGVDYILEGSVRKAGNDLRITAQLVKAVDGSHLWSKTYDKEFKIEDMFSVQEDIATAVANELKITLGLASSFRRLGSTDNVQAYELYLAAKGQFFDFKIDQALESIKAAIALDPEFALAWALKASIHWWGAIIMPAKISVAEQDAGLQAAQKAIEIEPTLRQGYLSLGIIKFVRGDFIEAGLAYSKAIELPAETLWGTDYFVSLYCIDVGYLEKAYEHIKAVKQNDPLNKDIRAFYLLNKGLIGDSQQAEEEYERCKALFADQWIKGDVFILYVRLGVKDISSDDIPEVSNLEPTLSAVRAHLESPEKALAEMRQIYNDDEDLSAGQLVLMATFAAYFGDPEFAMNAVEKSVSIEASGVGCVWFPVMKEVRQLPRFKEFVREIGLVDYWNKFGWPDICHELDNGVFECD